MPNLMDARATYGATLAFVSTRDELPLILNQRGLLGCGVEVGVKEGEFSETILRSWRGRHLISVDPWREDAPDAYVDIANVPQAQHERFLATTRARLAPFGARSSIWRTTSREAAERIPNHSLDFVYLDARHDRASVLEDLQAWVDKVRPGGILAGHDYVDGHFAAGVFGVRSAVDDFFAERGIPVHPTLLDEPWISWLVEIPWPAEDEVVEGTSANAPAAASGPPVGAASDARLVSLQMSGSRGAFGFQLILDPAHMSQQLMLQCLQANQVYEAETSQFFASVLRPGDTFVDVGTHVGFFSMLAAACVGPQGHVFSFEPDEYNFERIRDHIALNGFSHVHAVNQAVGRETGIAQFYVNADNDGGHALWDVGRHDFNQRSRANPQPRSVRVTSLDEFFAEHDPGAIKAIKIDVEGSEVAVLSGARETLTRYRVPFVVAEVNRFGLHQMGTTEAELRALMTELGYETWVFVPETATLERLQPSDTVESDYVFNLLFRHPQAPSLGA